MFSRVNRLVVPAGSTSLVLFQQRRFASNSAAKPTESSFSFVQWYESHLQSRPVPTKMVTGGILWGLGDVVAQAAPALVYPDKDKDKSTSFWKDYDTARTARAVFFGFAIHAPCAHVHYNFLESLTVRLKIADKYMPVFKAFMEQFVYWSWLSNALYHGAMGAMQGMNGQQIYDRIADVLWDTQKAQWAFWIPVQLLNFRFVPVRHQLNVVLVTSIVWTAFLSFVYPPVKNEADEKKVKEA